MGISPFSHWNSSSSFDNSKRTQVVYEKDCANCKKLNNLLNLPNPNPANYKILKSNQIENFLIVSIKYLDCKNYEGQKILLFENCTLKQLVIQKLIDPHFTDNRKFHSPIARFEPTDRGWEMAEALIEKLLTKE